MSQDIEKRLNDLETLVKEQQKQIADQNLEIERVKAARECENIINKYEKPWIDLDQKAPMTVPYEELAKIAAESDAVIIEPNVKATHPGWWWRPDVYKDSVPAPPEPYKSWEEETSY